MNFNISNESFSSSSSSDDEDFLIYNNNQAIQALLNYEVNSSTRRGSIPGHVIINRDREAADHHLMNEYFCDNPRYGDAMFCRRFRMFRPLFLRIVESVRDHDRYFQQRCDGLDRLGLSSLQKATTVFQMLAYGLSADAIDEYVRIGKSTTIESCKRFCRAIVEVFTEQYLRTLTANDIARLLYIGEQCGFPSMLGSLDCMHWRWKNCPTTWSGQFSGRSGNPTIILEVVADYDLWIWHAYFGMPATNNDINVLESSHFFSNLTQGIAPPALYVIQGQKFDMGYYLADGIYPKWSTIVQTIRDPQGPKKQYFAMRQESCKKDGERAFGVLQSRFAIVAGPTRFWEKGILHDIICACIIMHNMIIEDERDIHAPIIESREVIQNTNVRFQEFVSRHRKIRDREAHYALRNALIEHLWEHRRNVEE